MATARGPILMTVDTFEALRGVGGGGDTMGGVGSGAQGIRGEHLLGVMKGDTRRLDSYGYSSI